MHRTIAAGVLAATTATGALGQSDRPREAGSTIEAGLLSCELYDRTNVVVLSNARYSCRFEPVTESIPDEFYVATIGKVGVDLTVKQAETLKWAVLAAAGPVEEGLIAGEYIGASADAALGAGLGARVQVGGVDNSITLQPLSVSGSEGIGVAAGIEQLSMEYRGPLD